MLRGPAALEAIPPHVLLGTHVVLHLQGSVEDGLLLRRPAEQGELLVQGGLTLWVRVLGDQGSPRWSRSSLTEHGCVHRVLNGTKCLRRTQGWEDLKAVPSREADWVLGTESRPCPSF